MCVAVCGCTQSVIIRVVCLFRRRRRRNQSLFIGESIVNCEIVVDCKKCSQFLLQHPKCSTSPLGLIGRAHILAYSQSRLQIYDFFSFKLDKYCVECHDKTDVEFYAGASAHRRRSFSFRPFPGK